jgi:hypothetical protein
MIAACGVLDLIEVIVVLSVLVSYRNRGKVCQDQREEQGFSDEGSVRAQPVDDPVFFPVVQTAFVILKTRPPTSGRADTGEQLSAASSVSII